MILQPSRELCFFFSFFDSFVVVRKKADMHMDIDTGGYHTKIGSLSRINGGNGNSNMGS